MPPRRLNLELSESMQVRLDGLKSRTEATSYAEVIKNALRFYEAVIVEAETGSTFMVKTVSGQTKEYVIF